MNKKIDLINFIECFFKELDEGVIREPKETTREAIKSKQSEYKQKYMDLAQTFYEETGLKIRYISFYNTQFPVPFECEIETESF